PGTPAFPTRRSSDLERLRHLQRWALGFGAAAVVVLTAAYGRMPWIALVLAASFATYGFLKKSVPVDATTSLAVETSILLLPAARSEEHTSELQSREN